MSEETPIWKFESVKLTYLSPILKDGVKSDDMCHASFDFGFFIVTDIGIDRHRGFSHDDVTWSHDFSWSPFKLSLSQIDNPHIKEVTKLAMMIKEELVRKRDVIIGFLDSPNTMPEIIKEEEPDSK
jgi:hypothetical protein